MDINKYLKLSAQWNALSIEQQEIEATSILYKEFFENKKKYSVSAHGRGNHATELKSNPSYHLAVGSDASILLSRKDIISAISQINSENSINPIQSEISQKTIYAVMRDMPPKKISVVFGAELKYITDGVDRLKHENDFKRRMCEIGLPTASVLIIKKMQDQYSEQESSIKKMMAPPDGVTATIKLIQGQIFEQEASIKKMMSLHNGVAGAMQLIQEQEAKHQLYIDKMLPSFDSVSNVISIAQAQDAVLKKRLEIIDFAHTAVLGGSLLRILDNSNIELLIENELKKINDDYKKSSFDNSCMSMGILKENSSEISVSSSQESISIEWVPSADILAHDLVNAHANNDLDEIKRIFHHENFGPEVMFSALSLAKDTETDRKNLLNNTIKKEKIRSADSYKETINYKNKQEFIERVRKHKIIGKNIAEVLSIYRSMYDLPELKTNNRYKDWYSEGMPLIIFLPGRPKNLK